MNHRVHKEHKENKQLKESPEPPTKQHDPIAPPVERIIREVIGAAISVHRALGPGFLEPVYVKAMGVELRCRGLKYEEQKRILSYLKASGKRAGLLMNFNVNMLVDGLKRFVR